MKSKSLQLLNNLYTKSSQKIGFDCTLNQISVGEMFHIPFSKDTFQNLGRFRAVNLRTNELIHLSSFAMVRKSDIRSTVNYFLIKLKSKFNSLMRFVKFA
jgi:hypothetical protein